jgi:hypothetical protein
VALLATGEQLDASVVFAVREQRVEALEFLLLVGFHTASADQLVVESLTDWTMSRWCRLRADLSAAASRSAL